MKKCTKCLELKTIDCFYKYRATCAICYAIQTNKWRNNNIELVNKNKDLWDKSNIDRKKKSNRDYYVTNLETIRAKHKDYRILNKENISTHCRVRSQKDINFRLTRSLRSRLNIAIRNNWKTGSAIKDLGCSIVELKTYLESHFQSGMTWENYGRTGWHIDHIRPLSSFNLNNEKQFKQACHFSNLQPLWAKENISKSNKWSTNDEVC